MKTKTKTKKPKKKITDIKPIKSKLRKERKTCKQVLAILIILLVAIAAYLFVSEYYLLEEKETNEEPTMSGEKEAGAGAEEKRAAVLELDITEDPLSLENFTEANITIRQNALILSKDCTALVMFVNDVQALSVQRALDEEIGFRPMTHDTIRSILDSFNIGVTMVKIVDMQEGAFIANLFLKQEGEDQSQILNLDARPSDAIAIALRTGSPIYVKEELFNLYGKQTCRSS